MSSPENQPSDQARIVFFGDSRAAQWPAPDIQGVDFINRGIGGQTSAQTVHRFDQHIRPLAPEIILIQVGVNDLKTIPLFPERKRQIVVSCQENIAEIVARSLELEALVIVSTIFPVGNVPLARQLFWSDEVAESVNEVNAYIHSLVQPNVVIFDAFSILADDQDLLKLEYERDELHLNNAGYEALNEALRELIAGLSQS